MGRGAAYLEDGEQCLVECVEVVARYCDAAVIAELAAEQLHAEQREDDDEEKQQQQQAGDRTHAVDERRHQITQRRPVPAPGHTTSSVLNVVVKVNQNCKSAVAGVGRPYSWCTLATCVRNCPSTMFRTCCCLRPKCKRSYLLIYITSDTS